MAKKKKKELNEQDRKSKSAYVRNWVILSIVSSLGVPFLAVLWDFMVQQNIIAEFDVSKINFSNFNVYGGTADFLLAINGLLFSSVLCLKNYNYKVPENKTSAEIVHWLGICVTTIMYIFLVKEHSGIVKPFPTTLIVIYVITAIIYILFLVWTAIKEYNAYIPEKKKK